MDYSFACLCFVFKQKTAYEMRISDWSSDVCSSDLQASPHPAWSGIVGREREMILPECVQLLAQIARAAPQIALDAVPIDAETRGRRRHQLGQTEGVLGRHDGRVIPALANDHRVEDRKSTRLNSSH